MTSPYYSPVADPRVEHVVDLLVEAVKCAATEDFISADTLAAQSAAQNAIYDLATELTADYQDGAA